MRFTISSAPPARIQSGSKGTRAKPPAAGANASSANSRTPEVAQILHVVEQVAGRADRLEANALVTLPEILWTFPGRQYRMSVALRRLK